VELPRDWSEFIDLLCSHRVRFLVVGAHALAASGRPRATQDLDLLVEPSLANARRLGEALARFGFRELAREADRFAVPDRMAVLGREPLRIDIMTSITGVSFAEAWAGRRRIKLGNRMVGFLGEAELIRNKSSTGRAKDLLDLALLEEARPAKRPPKSRRRRPRRRRDNR
jgi:hypothetical protein